VRRAARRNGIAAGEEFVKAGNMTSDAAAAAFGGFLEKKRPLPDCILCGNDVMAFGVIETLRKNGFRVPEDVFVAGSDDILVSRYYHPPLTTIHYDFDEILETLTAGVIDCVEKPFAKPFTANFHGRLVVRDSFPPGLRRKAGGVKKKIVFGNGLS
jgi:DNA-binding LacI/PurR family transcriptional regulator